MKNFRGIPETATVISDLTVIENNVLYVVSICDGDRVLSSMGRIFPLGKEISGEAVLEDAVKAFARIHESEQTGERMDALPESQQSHVAAEDTTTGESEDNTHLDEAEGKALEDDGVLTTETTDEPAGLESEVKKPEPEETRATGKKTTRKTKRAVKAEENPFVKEEDQNQLIEAAMDLSFVALECAPPNIHKLVGMKMRELNARYKTVLSYIWVQHEMGIDYVPESCMDAVKILLKK